MNGDVAQKKRERIIEQLRNGEVDVLVATDVAARGLDVQRLSHVINFDLPHDSEAYIHRIGRTGRAGRSGEAILFLHPREQQQLKRLEKETRQVIKKMDLPSNRDVNKERVASFHDKITAGLGHKELETFQSIVTQYQREHDVSLEMIAASLAALANNGHSLLVKGQLQQDEFTTAYRSGARDRDSGRPYRSNGPRSTGPRDEAGMQTFRIEVGRQHFVQPGNIVGAIANNAGIEGSSIGRIQIFDRFSTVDLPESISPQKLNEMQEITVGGQKLRISALERQNKESSSKPYPKRNKNNSTFKAKKSKKRPR